MKSRETEREAKLETKPETKPEAKPETKPEAKPKVALSESSFGPGNSAQSDREEPTEKASATAGRRKHSTGVQAAENIRLKAVSVLQQKRSAELSINFQPH